MTSGPRRRRPRISSARRGLRAVRTALRPLQLYIAVAAGVLTTVLSTVYDSLPTKLRIGALVLIGLMSGAVLLLTGTGSAPVANERDDSGDWPTSARAGVGATEPRRWRLRWRRRRPRRPVPPPAVQFTGREAELEMLIREHDAQRAARTAARSRANGVDDPAGRSAIGCVALYLHGAPGVGKSAIAVELARRLHQAGGYADGVIRVDLGTAGTARPPGEVLRELILALGWDETQVPTDPHGLATAFRSQTRGRSLLFVFDAARSTDQVEAILPTDPHNAVIVTSRRDITANRNIHATGSFLIEVPTEAEALQIFRAMSHTDNRDGPDCAADIVEQCGRLPMAVQSVAEQITGEDTSSCSLASHLRIEPQRLSRLDRPGRPVRTIIETEFDRLLPAEQRALIALAWLPSPSFAPWVLMPLIRVSAGQAEALTDRLLAAQLIRIASGQPLVRYTVQPLIRLFAVQRANDRCAASKAARDERDAALARVDQAYQTLIAAVLTRQAPASPVTVTHPSPMVAQLRLPERVAANDEAVTTWIRLENRSIVRQMIVAYEHGHRDLCWRLGALLNGATPADADYAQTAEAYRLAVLSAEKTGDPEAVASVHLAFGRFRASVGGYEEAKDAFETAVEAAKRLGDGRREKIAASLVRGEALVVAGSHDRGRDLLEYCLQRATDAGPAGQVQAYAAEIMLAFSRRVECPRWVLDRLQDGTLDEIGRFYASLAFADSSRRAHDWVPALRHLQTATQYCTADLARTAFVWLETADLHLQHARYLRLAEPEDGRGEDEVGVEQIDLAIQAACAAWWRYRQLGHTNGERLAECALARSFVSAGVLGEAEIRVDALRSRVESIPENDELNQALFARVHQAEGELQYRLGNTALGRTTLIRAASEVGHLGDVTRQNEIKQTIQRPPGVPVPKPRSPIR